MLWCLSGFSRLTAHETALLIFAALMVVSFTLLLHTEKQIFPAQYIYSVQTKPNLRSKHYAYMHSL